MFQQAKQRGWRIAEDEHFLPGLLHRNIHRRHRAGHPPALRLAHHPRVADIAAAFAAKAGQQGFVDPGQRHGGIGIQRAGPAQGLTQRDQGIRRKPQNIQPVEVSGGVDHPLDNRLVQRAGETVVRSRFGDDLADDVEAFRLDRLRLLDVLHQVLLRPRRPASSARR